MSNLTTPDVIRTLQRKLYTKAKQEPAYRFYARVTRYGGQTSSCLPTAASVPTKVVPVSMG